MENEIETSSSIWDKKQDDLTVAESMKIGIGVTVIATLAPLVVIMTVGGAAHLWEKFKNRKKNKLEIVNNEEN
jgi:hypothetical protein